VYQYCEWKVMDFMLASDPKRLHKFIHVLNKYNLRVRMASKVLCKWEFFHML
jgi:hypothetical protein